MTRTVTNYAATVRILLTDDIKDEGMAADALSAFLSENGIYNDAIKNWSYLQGGDGAWLYAEQVEVPADYDRDEHIIPGASFVSDRANDTVDALVLAQAQLETFAEFDKGNGGEDSDLHTALEAVKAAIVREQTRPDLLSFVKRHAKRNPIFAKGHEKEIIAEARRLVAQAEGR